MQALLEEALDLLFVKKGKGGNRPYLVYPQDSRQNVVLAFRRDLWDRGNGREGNMTVTHEQLKEAGAPDALAQLLSRKIRCASA